MNEAGVEKPLAELRSVLIPGETLEAWAVQRRLFALAHRRVLIAATSGRLIVLTRRLLGWPEYMAAARRSRSASSRCLSRSTR